MRLVRLAAIPPMVILAGCGSSAGLAAKPSPCPPRARAAFAAFDRVRPAAVSVSVGRGPELVNCTFRAGAVTAKATLDSSPQAYFRLERTIEEDAQQFASVREYSPPSNLNHLGVAAAWFPDQTKVMTTDGVRLITVAVQWPGARRSRKRALGVVVAKPLLGKLHPPP